MIAAPETEAAPEDAVKVKAKRRKTTMRLEGGEMRLTFKGDVHFQDHSQISPDANMDAKGPMGPKGP